MRREFRIIDDQGKNLDIVAKFESLAGQEPHFSITSQHGSDHDAMLACAPPEVADDVAALVAVHLCHRDGDGIHAVANAAHWMAQGEVEKAVASLGRVATAEDVVRLARTRAELGVTRSGGLRSAAARALEAAAGRVAAEEQKLATARRDGTVAFKSRLQGALLDFAGVRSGKEPLTIRELTAPESVQAGKALLDGEVHAAARRIARDGLSTRETEAISARVDRALMSEAAEELLEQGGLRARWREAADRAIEALSRPDYILAGRPDPSVDPRAFDGFAAVNGLSLEILSARPIEDRRTECSCRLKHAATGEAYEFTYSGPARPDVADVLESFQSDCGSVMHCDVDEFLQELGYTGDIKQVRQGEKAYEGCKAEGRALLSMLGEERMVDFLSQVGDSAPLASDSLPPNAFSSDAPAPSMR